MRVRPLALPLLAALWLCGSGCTPGDGSPATREIAGSGRYQLAGRAVECQVFAAPVGVELSPGPLDNVSVELVGAARPNGAFPTLTVEYHHPPGQLNAPYQAVLLTYWSGEPHESPVLYHHPVGTLTETSRHVFAGTFAGGPANASVTRGAFTGAPLVLDVLASRPRRHGAGVAAPPTP